MKIGIIREGKMPPDKRVPFTPEQCKTIKEQYPSIELVIQPSPIRCFPDQAYSNAGISLQEDLSDCDVLFGVKEVPLDDLIPEKHYFFFSHTHKFQPYNRPLIQAIIQKEIQLTDYECLTYPNGNRVLGFGRFAGLVGAYNGLLTYGKREGLYTLKPANLCDDLRELNKELHKVKLPPIKIVLTGSGRVAKGANEILEALSIKRVNADRFLSETFEEPVYTWIDADEYVEHKEGKPFDFKHFYAHGEEYQSNFKRFTKVTDLFIAGHFWDNRSPVFFTEEDVKSAEFKIKTIADISCDIACAIPSTVRPSTIANPVYDYNPQTGEEATAYSSKDHITVMAVDNLPCELPKDASEDFGQHLLDHILPLLLVEDPDQILHKATITKKGQLNEPFQYMQDFVEGKA
ncbi:NAD(P)-dependent oxidoreductase [Algivirga pacifica]|uniref:Saccharopine dehydrogenase [NAD(+), L-lysine-forming] n=1 Tax=Algivirga pacifica TaxID=1162670 RepID=A0ABP9D1R2_9BACT